MQFKHPEIWIGVLILAVLGLLTLTLQLMKAIDILATITDIWVFGIVAPIVGFASALILRGLSRSSGTIAHEQPGKEADPMLNIEMRRNRYEISIEELLSKVESEYWNLAVTLAT